MPEREGGRQTEALSFDPTEITYLLVLSPFYCSQSLDVLSSLESWFKHALSLAYTLQFFGPLRLQALAGPNINPD